MILRDRLCFFTGVWLDSETATTLRLTLLKPPLFHSAKFPKCVVLNDSYKIFPDLTRSRRVFHAPAAAPSTQQTEHPPRQSIAFPRKPPVSSAAFREQWQPFALRTRFIQKAGFRSANLKRRQLEGQEEMVLMMASTTSEQGREHLRETQDLMTTPACERKAISSKSRYDKVAEYFSETYSHPT